MTLRSAKNLDIFQPYPYVIPDPKNVFIKYMSIVRKQASKPKPYAARRARKSLQYISCVVEVVKNLHLRYTTAQREDCIDKHSFFAACFFFIHTFLFCIFKAWKWWCMAAGFLVSKTQMKPEYGVLFEIAKSVYVQADERPSGGVDTYFPSSLPLSPLSTHSCSAYPKTQNTRMMAAILPVF